MEITILNTNLVFPSQPPFAAPHHLLFSPLDAAPDLRTVVRTLRIYSGGLPDPVLTISLALSRALVLYYPFAATFSSTHLSCSPGQGVPLTSAAANLPLSALDAGLAADFAHRLAPELGAGEAMAIQITVFPCGGFAVGMSVQHALCDGLGAAQFLAAGAAFARGEEPAVAPVWARDRVLPPRVPPRVDFPIGEFLSVDDDFSPYSPPAWEIARESFEIRDEWVAKLRSEMKEKSGSGFTTFEALGAFIWRSRVVATGVPSEETVKFVYPANIRDLISPPMPAGYWGNGCVPVYARARAGDVAGRPLWETAEVVRRSKGIATDEYVRSYVDFLAVNAGERVTAGRWVTGVTDWRHLDHSAADLGSGGPVAVVPVSWGLMGSMEPCFLLPAPEKKGWLKVVVSVPATAAAALRAEMGTLGSCL